MSEKNTKTAPAIKQENPNITYSLDNPADVFLNPALYAQIQRAAALLAASKLVPAHFRNDPPSCFIAVQMATRMRMDPFMLMQRTFVISGKPGFEAQFVIALVNKSGLFRDPLDWELSGTGKDRKAVCYTHRHDGKRVQAECSMAMADAEGWSKKDGSKWKTLPDQMLQYRSAAFFGRLHCPEVMMGMTTVEELYDADDTSRSEPLRTVKVLNPEADAPTDRADEVGSKLKAKRKKHQEVRDVPVDESCAEDSQEDVEGGHSANAANETLETMPIDDLRAAALHRWTSAGYDQESAEHTLGSSYPQWTRGKCLNLIHVAQMALDEQAAAGI